jgi:glycosyltransferase
MKLSVITASLNSGRTIADAIRSVAAQTHPDVEHIVVDGGSTDGTMEIVDSFGARIARRVSEPDRGIYDALNKGIRMATGDVVGFLHSDDLYAREDVLETVAAAFRNDWIDSVYGDLQYVRRDDTSRVLRHWKAGDFSRFQLRVGWMPPHPALFVRRAVYERYGAFDTAFRISADYDVMLRFLGTYGISTRYLPAVLVLMRVGGASNRNLGNIVRKSLEDYRVIRKNRLGGAFTLMLKNLRKVRQFTDREP